MDKLNLLNSNWLISHSKLKSVWEARVELCLSYAWAYTLSILLSNEFIPRYESSQGSSILEELKLKENGIYFLQDLLINLSIETIETYTYPHSTWLKIHTANCEAT